MDPKFFVRPRPKKALLVVPNKKRKIEHKIEEITYDATAREDYLTGFHKRKVARAKLAQEQAAKMAKAEKIVIRKQLRDERKQELEEHVEAVNALLQDFEEPNLESDGEDGWEGCKDEAPEPVDHEEEYIDEDKYTTVTVEEVNVSKEGMRKAIGDEDEEETKEYKPKEPEKEKKVWPKKPRKKKFTYETKAERKFTRSKQKAGNKAKADARRGED